MSLLLFVFRPVLFEGEQFAFRDAASFYYPLYERVQQEWDAGRWPLWDPGQNAGMPLLGNPTAAVLYPGKLIYAALPYPWAARAYVIVHVLIACLGMAALSRSLGVSRVGSSLAAISYGFGGPVIFQYCNVIFLVGGAWIPWGLRAINRMLREGKQVAIAELALVLALQVLGGDPEAAYLTGISGLLYAVILSSETRMAMWRHANFATLAMFAVSWLIGVSGLAWVRPAWLRATWNGTVSLGLCTLIAIIVMRWCGREQTRRLSLMLAKLGCAAVLAFALAGAQILPILELVAGGRRAAGMNTTELYHFGLDPFRVVELIWPGVFGLIAPENRSWVQAFPRRGDHDPWDASLYVGGMVPLLALLAAGRSARSPARTWLTILALGALAGSFGKYGGPLWWLRFAVPGATLGPHDPLNGELRVDEYLGDGAGSVYSILLMILPGFQSFRYPAKLTILFSAALTALAGLGWDRMLEGNSKRVCRWAGIGCAVSALMLVLAVVSREAAIEWLKARVTTDLAFGPPKVRLAWAETARALGHGTVVLAALLVISQIAARRPRKAATLALAVLSIDLAIASARLIWTVPQGDFDSPSEAARVIEELERNEPATSPYRIHRTANCSLIPHYTTSTLSRISERTRWDRETLSPLVGLPLRFEYCETVGNLEPDDYSTFFRYQADLPCPPRMASVLRVPAFSPIYYVGRRTFDLWGARYLILPAWPDWRDPQRGFAAFLPHAELVFPDRETLVGAKLGPDGKVWAENHDWQVFKNQSAFPRAWIVHGARVRPVARTVEARERLMDMLLYMNDPFLEEPGRVELNLRESALIETDDGQTLRSFLKGHRPRAGESIEFNKYEPQRVELTASLEAPGLVILADTFYPGWKLEIDGKPAPIYRANRLMRGAAVPAGVHSLVYRYDPQSFRMGSVLSCVGLSVWLITIIQAWRKSRAETR